MKTYKVNIYNEMFGYERNETVEIKAKTEEDALYKAQQIDRYASVSLVSENKNFLTE